ncbi:hypothetical protein JCM19232_3714 [Vibrio ishigakensis]|uniref:Uncharacterized protein n=1 Tax=Vibrio ishigakensis TaxID=1481914 RepID=A0A0B8P875_9VIBR|nr:hypothetical protein JCM19232_3714 [Vibrio ishigakensis]
MKRVKQLVAVIITCALSPIASASVLNDISNEQLLFCANVSGVHGASIESRTAFRNYLVTERGYKYSKLVDSERAYLSGMTEEQQQKAKKAYQDQCADTGNQLFFKGY